MKNDYEQCFTSKTTKIQAIQMKLSEVKELPDDDNEIGPSWLEHLMTCADTMSMDDYLTECERFARIVPKKLLPALPGDFKGPVDKWDVYFMVQVARRYEDIQTKRALEKLKQLQHQR